MAMLTIEWQSSAHPEKRPSEVPKTRHLTPDSEMLFATTACFLLGLVKGAIKKTEASDTAVDKSGR